MTQTAPERASVGGMTPRVRQGLGLLVVAVVGVLLVQMGRDGMDSSIGPVVYLVGWLALAVGLFGGLALLSYGLLRGR